MTNNFGKRGLKQHVFMIPPLTCIMFDPPEIGSKILWSPSVFQCSPPNAEVNVHAVKTVCRYHTRTLLCSPRCFADMRRPTGPVIQTVFGSFVVVAFITNLICYVGVWTTISHTSRQINVSSTEFTKSLMFLKPKSVIFRILDSITM